MKLVTFCKLIKLIQYKTKIKQNAYIYFFRYERNSDDVKSMIKHAKLDEKNLTQLTQAIYYPSSNQIQANLKLLELNPHLMKQIEEGQTLCFKGGLNEKVVLCTETKTFEIKEAEISNSLLLIPGIKLAQETSKSPLKSPKGMNKSLDRSCDDEEDLDIHRDLERKEILCIFHDYYECREVKPKYRKISDLLQLTRYSGPENEHAIDRKLLFTFDQLFDTVQCSRGEFLEGLSFYKAIQIDDYWRCLQFEYEYRIISLMIAVIGENSWNSDEVDKHTTVEALDGICPLEIVDGLFDIYTEPGKPNFFKYKEDSVCRIVAQNMLQLGQKFHVDEFLSIWQEALPEGMNFDEKYLSGIGIIDRESKPQCVLALNEINLSTNLSERLKILFKTKEKWTLEQIGPYIEYFATPQLQVTAVLAKHARATTVNGKRLYVAKHGRV